MPEAAFAGMAEAEDALAPETENSGPAPARTAALRHRTWLFLNERRHQMRARWAEFFQRFDVLLMPATPVTAIRHDHSDRLTRTIAVNGASRDYNDQLAWVGLITMAYLPATVAPVGLSRAGLPVGVQIAGPYLEDRTTIDFAERLAGVIGGFQAPPGYE